MSQNPTVIVHFKDLDGDDTLREVIDRHCQRLAEEFRETTRFEMTVEPHGVGFTAHAHVTGKGTDVGTHAQAEEPRTAMDRVVEKVERQLRRQHDKRIFAQRREAQKAPPKRKIT